jgi:hypothetical protein
VEGLHGRQRDVVVVEVEDRLGPHVDGVQVAQVLAAERVVRRVRGGGAQRLELLLPGRREIDGPGARQESVDLVGRRALVVADHDHAPAVQEFVLVDEEERV